jgi:hypothetical protein
MAFHTPKEGHERWKDVEAFKRDGTCLCCKRPIAMGESGKESVKGRADVKSFLCIECVTEWKEKFGPIFRLSRFKLK